MRWLNTTVSARMRRVNEALRAVLSEAILELKDPRVGFVTITGVEATSDLKQATVYVSVLGSERKRARSLDGARCRARAAPGRIGRELRMKRTPQLTFEYDPSVAEGVRMSKLIDDLITDDD